MTSRSKKTPRTVLGGRFVDNLRHLLAERGLSVTKFAVEIGMSGPQLAAIMRGEVGVTLYIIERVCEGAGVDPIAMLEEWP